MKCIVCSPMKGKEVILGFKLNTLEKNVGKTKIIQNMPHLGKKEKGVICEQKCTHAKNEIIYSQQSRISIVEQVIEGGLKKEKGTKR